MYPMRDAVVHPCVFWHVSRAMPGSAATCRSWSASSQRPIFMLHTARPLYSAAWVAMGQRTCNGIALPGTYDMNVGAKTSGALPAIRSSSLRCYHKRRTLYFACRPRAHGRPRSPGNLGRAVGQLRSPSGCNVPSPLSPNLFTRNE